MSHKHNCKLQPFRRRWVDHSDNRRTRELEKIMPVWRFSVYDELL